MLPEGFNWLDPVIAILLTLALVQGIRAGLIRSTFNIAGVAGGLILAIKYYVYGSILLLNYVNLPQFLADAVSFMAIFSLVSVTVYILGSFFAIITRFSLIKFVDKIGGSAVGLLIGLIFVGVLLVLLTAFPVYNGFQEHFEDSYLAPPIVETTYDLYDQLSELLPLELPRLTVYPEEMSSYINSINSYPNYSGVDYKQLDGATCFACGGPVEFLGYLDNNKDSVSPKFTCTECGRTSDGCQTYEGYHEMYDKCPVVLGNQGYRLDCGIWTNYRYLRPTGLCPVCEAE